MRSLKKINYIWLLLFLTVFSCIQIHPVFGEITDPAYLQFVQTQLFDARVISFTPQGYTNAIGPTTEVAGSKLFDLSAYNMPPIRVSIGGANWVGENTLGQTLMSARLANGSYVQVVAFVKKYYIDLDLLFQTEISQGYISDVYRQDISAPVLFIENNILGVYGVDYTLSRWVNIPSFHYPSDYVAQAQEVASGIIGLEFAVDPTWTFAPASVINGTSGQYELNDYFSYWVGITDAKAGDIIESQGTTGTFSINTISEAPPNPGQVMSTSIGGVSVAGTYNGPVQTIVETVAGGTWDSEESGTPLDLYIKVTNESVPETPFYDPSLGPRLLDVQTGFFMKLQPIIESTKVKHSVSFAHVRRTDIVPFVGWVIDPGFPHYAANIHDAYMGFSSSNTWRKQRVQVTLTTVSYYDFTPYQENEGYIADPNEIVGDLALDVWGSGSQSAVGTFVTIYDVLFMAAIFVGIAAAVIIGIYLVYRKIRSRGKSSPSGGPKFGKQG